MKNLSIILILSIYLFSTTELIQLLKIPILISHCLDHKKNNNKLTIEQFLIDHYNNHKKDGDWNIDQQLPFIKHYNSLNITAIHSTVSHHIQKLISSIFFENKTLFYQEKNQITTYMDNIWQPPKFI